MKWLAARVLAMLAMLAFGQAHAADWDCLPTTALTPLASGSARLIVTKPSVGEASGWWCLDPTAPAGKVAYRPNYFTCLDKYCVHPDSAGALSRVWAAPVFLDAVNGERRVAAIAPVAGSMDEYEFRSLKHRACLALATPPYLVPIDPLPADYCGAAPVMPAPPAPTYTHFVKTNGLVSTRPAYLLTAGVRGTKEVARAAVAQPCDLTRPLLASGADVWAEFGPAFEPGKVALCARR